MVAPPLLRNASTHHGPTNGADLRRKNHPKRPWGYLFAEKSQQTAVHADEPVAQAESGTPERQQLAGPNPKADRRTGLMRPVQCRGSEGE